MKKNIPYFFFIFTCICLLSCNWDEVEDVPLDEIELELEVQRFDLAEWNAKEALLQTESPTLKQIYDGEIAPFRSFITDLLYMGIDSVGNEAVITEDLLVFFLPDSSVGQLLDSVKNKFPPDYDFESILRDPLKRFKYYFPENEIPEIYTYVTGYSQNEAKGFDQVHVSNRSFGLGLHYFLGADFSFYPPTLPLYIRRQFQEDRIAVALFKEIGKRLIPPLKPWDNPRLLDHVIQRGIGLYFLDKMLPFTQDSLKINYNPQQMYWADYFEGRIFKKILPNIYSSDYTLEHDYLEEKPFTSDLARESAPRLGEYTGWQIVRSYMHHHPELTLVDLIHEKDYEKILKSSKYRPEVRE